MPNEKKEKVVEQIKAYETIEKQDEKEIVEKKNDDVVEQKDGEKAEQKEIVEEKKNDTETEESKGEEKQEPVVEEETTSHEAIRVEDLMTKEEFEAKMSAFEAKFEALVKENQDLKEQNAQLLDGKEKAEAETENLKNKYEKNDFGNIASKNIGSGEKVDGAYQTYAEYSKKFM